MRLIVSPLRSERLWLSLCLMLILAMPLRALAQDAVSTEAVATEQPVEQPVEQAAPQEEPVPTEADAAEEPVIEDNVMVPGAVQISLASDGGASLSGSFAITDADGAYQEVWVDGAATAWELAPGQAFVTQLSGTTDFGFDASSSRAVAIPSGDVAYVAFTNAFLDADSDGVGDSADVCANGDDAVDTDGDGTADACDDTPDGDAPADETSAVTLEVDQTDVVVADAPVTCQESAAAAPTITSDLGDYPPGALVTLTGAGWVPGQNVELLVEDDGVADAEQGAWNHTATAVADEQGAFTYQFNLAPWFVANYTVVATGECSKAETAFTDSVTGSGCTQISSSDVIGASNPYIAYKCSVKKPIKFNVTSVTSGWQWRYAFADLEPATSAFSAWSTAPASGDSEAGGGTDFVFFHFQPTGSALLSIGNLSVTVMRSNGNDATSNTLTANTPITYGNFTHSCTPPSPLTVQVPGSQVITCTVAISNIGSGTTVNVTVPSITAPSGWTITNQSALTGTLTGSSGNTNASFQYTFTLSPSACATPFTASRTPSLSFGTQSAISAPTATVTANAASATTVSTSITGSTLAWSRPYSLSSYPTNAGSLTYSVQTSGCGGWNVTVAASPFAKAGSPATTIPASNLTLTSSTTPAGTGIGRPVTSGSLAGGLRVLNASVGTADGTYSQTLNLNLNIPGGTLVGNYTSTITVTAASGP